jgi:hypothetical protein
MEINQYKNNIGSRLTPNNRSNNINSNNNDFNLDLLIKDSHPTFTSLSTSSLYSRDHCVSPIDGSRSYNDKKKNQVLEAAFRYQNITIDNAEKFISHLTSVKALDLSFNKLSTLPRCIPQSVIALDISANSVFSLDGFKRIDNIIELKLRNNKIQSTFGLNAAVGLQYLDLSFNEITRVEGLVSLVNLKSLFLENNSITNSIELRPLSFNIELTVLDLRDNPVTLIKNYKHIINNFAPYLIKLDDEKIKNQIQSKTSSKKSSYGDLYIEKKINTKVITGNDNIYEPLSSRNSPTYYYNGNALPVNHNHQLEFDDSYTDISHSPNNVVTEVKSAIPWRNAPKIIPRPLKGGGGGSINNLIEKAKIKQSNARRIDPSLNKTGPPQWNTPLINKKSSKNKPNLTEAVQVLGLPVPPSPPHSPQRIFSPNQIKLGHYSKSTVISQNRLDESIEYHNKPVLKYNSEDVLESRSKSNVSPTRAISQSPTKKILSSREISQSILQDAYNDDDIVYNSSNNLSFLRYQNVQNLYSYDTQLNEIVNQNENQIQKNDELRKSNSSFKSTSSLSTAHKRRPSIVPTQTKAALLRASHTADQIEKALIKEQKENKFKIHNKSILKNQPKEFISNDDLSSPPPPPPPPFTSSLNGDNTTNSRYALLVKLQESLNPNLNDNNNNDLINFPPSYPQEKELNEEDSIDDLSFSTLPVKDKFATASQKIAKELELLKIRKEESIKSIELNINSKRLK